MVLHRNNVGSRRCYSSSSVFCIIISISAHVSRTRDGDVANGGRRDENTNQNSITRVRRFRQRGVPGVHLISIARGAARRRYCLPGKLLHARRADRSLRAGIHGIGARDSSTHCEAGSCRYRVYLPARKLSRARVLDLT